MSDRSVHTKKRINDTGKNYIYLLSKSQLILIYLTLMKKLCH